MQPWCGTVQKFYTHSLRVTSEKYICGSFTIINRHEAKRIESNISGICAQIKKKSIMNRKREALFFHWKYVNFSQNMKKIVQLMSWILRNKVNEFYASLLKYLENWDDQYSQIKYFQRAQSSNDLEWNKIEECFRIIRNAIKFEETTSIYFDNNYFSIYMTIGFMHLIILINYKTNHTWIHCCYSCT